MIRPDRRLGHLQSKTSLGNHFSGIRSNDVAPEDLVCVLLDEELDETFLVVVCLRTGVG